MKRRHHTHRTRTPQRSHVRHTVHIGAVFVALLIIVASVRIATPVRVADMKFTDTSSGGLQIVPASEGTCNDGTTTTVNDACPGDMCFNLSGVQGGPPSGYYQYDTPGVYRLCCPNGTNHDAYHCSLAKPAMHAVQCNANSTATLSWSAVLTWPYTSSVLYPVRYSAPGLSCPATGGWWSASAGECDLDNNSATSVTVPITYGTTYQWWVHAYDGGTGLWSPTPSPLGSFSCAAPAASCTAPWGATVASGEAVTAYQAASVAYGSSCVSQQRTCTNGTLSGTYQYQTCSVTPPPQPTATISADSPSILVGQSTVVRATFAAGAGDTLVFDNIDQPLGSGVGASTDPDPTKTYTFAPSSAGTYTFYARAVTSYFTSWTTYATTNVTVTAPANCTAPWGATVSHGASVTAYQTSSVPYGGTCSSQTRTCTNGTLSGSYQYSSCTVGPAANCTLDGVTVLSGSSRTFYQQRTTIAGQLCSSIAQTRTCTNGVLSGDDSYMYATCSCAAAYYCSGSTPQYSDASCNVTSYPACVPPGQCVAGQSSCVYGAITATFTAQPQIVTYGGRSTLYWNVANAQSCTVMGNGQAWNQTSSDGVQTNPIFAQTTYTLNCTAYPGQGAFTPRTVDILLQPQYKEQ